MAANPLPAATLRQAQGEGRGPGKQVKGHGITHIQQHDSKDPSGYRLNFVQSLVQSLGFDEAVAARRRPELTDMLSLVRGVGADICGN